MMKGKGAPPADLLVCFPSRAHLSLMPKPICSPARSSEPSNRHHHHHHKKSGSRGGPASPLLWAKTKPSSSEMTSEPTSPKVTCAGQIKVRTKTAGTCKNWQSVMEEIERIHNHRKQKKAKPNWIEAIGLKKEIVQFMACLRNIRFDFRCFGSPIPESDLTSEEEEEDDEVGEKYFPGNRTGQEEIGGDGSSRTIFSKWFMVLQENQGSSSGTVPKQRDGGENRTNGEEETAVAPPANALLLMRCRSAPAKSWLEEKREEENLGGRGGGGVKGEEEEDEKEKFMGMEEEKTQRKDNLLVMRYGADFYKLSSEIAKETWVVGGVADPFSRSRSWKR